VRRLEVLNALALDAIRHLGNLNLPEAYLHATRQQPMEPGLQRILVWTCFNARMHHIHTRVTTARTTEIPQRPSNVINGYIHCWIPLLENLQLILRSFSMVVNVSGEQGAFNEAYRYVDWLLTVPLLLVEVIAVLALAKEVSKSLIMRLVPASAAMIALGYPGEISSDNNTKILWGVLSTIPFLYILYVLFVELAKSLDRQPAGVAATIGRLRLASHWYMGRLPNLIPTTNTWSISNRSRRIC